MEALNGCENPEKVTRILDEIIREHNNEISMQLLWDEFSKKSNRPFFAWFSNNKARIKNVLLHLYSPNIEIAKDKETKEVIIKLTNVTEESATMSKQVFSNTGINIENTSQIEILDDNEMQTNQVLNDYSNSNNSTSNSSNASTNVIEKYSFKHPHNLIEFTNVLNKIFKENNNKIDLSMLPIEFQKKTKATISSWFVKNVKLYELLHDLFSTDVEITRYSNTITVILKKKELTSHLDYLPADISLGEAESTNDRTDVAQENSCRESIFSHLKKDFIVSTVNHTNRDETSSSNVAEASKDAYSKAPENSIDKLYFKSPYNLYEFTKVLNEIFKQNNKEIDLSLIQQEFKNLTKTTMSTWFKKKVKISQFLKDVYPTSIEIIRKGTASFARLIRDLNQVEIETKTKETLETKDTPTIIIREIPKNSSELSNDNDNEVHTDQTDNTYAEGNENTATVNVMEKYSIKHPHNLVEFTNVLNTILKLNNNEINLSTLRCEFKKVTSSKISSWFVGKINFSEMFQDLYPTDLKMIEKGRGTRRNKISTTYRLTKETLALPFDTPTADHDISKLEKNNSKISEFCNNISSIETDAPVQMLKQGNPERNTYLQPSSTDTVDKLNVQESCVTMPITNEESKKILLEQTLQKQTNQRNEDIQIDKESNSSGLQNETNNVTSRGINTSTDLENQYFKDPYNLIEFSKILDVIFDENDNQIDLRDLARMFKKVAKERMRIWFHGTMKFGDDSLINFFQDLFPFSVEILLKKGNTTFVRRKNGAINDACKGKMLSDTQIDNNVANSVALQCPELKEQYCLLHVMYVKVRLLAMFYELDCAEIELTKLIMFFQDIFIENVFKDEIANDVLKTMQTMKTNSSTKEKLESVKKFIKLFLADILKVNDTIIKIVCDVPMMYNHCINQLQSLITDINRPEFTIKELPTDMQVIANDESTDVTDKRNYHFHFPDIQASSINKKYDQLPTMDEVNDRVNLIRKRIAQRGNAVNVVEVLRELCNFYQVQNMSRLRLKQGTGAVTHIYSDQAIPAVRDLVRLQCKVNAFVQAFVTFRNICTLHELENELCKMEELSRFEDFKLGPLQKQLVVYKHFLFPPEQSYIPTITTEHVFRMLWKFHIKKKQESNSYKKMDLQEFFTYLMEEYNFSSPYESGVKIGSVSLAMQVVKKAAFGNNEYEREIKLTFKRYIVTELKKHASESADLITNQFSLNTLCSEFINKDIATVFSDIMDMLDRVEREMSKKLPRPTTLLINAVNVKNFLNMIKKEKVLNQMFHILMSVAPLRILGKDDVDILNSLGFGVVINEMVLEGIESTKLHKKQCEKSKYVKRSLVYSTLKKWIEKNHEMDICNLSKIEQQILLELQPISKSFEELGHGSFLQFMTKDEELNKLLQKKFIKTPDLKNAAAVSNDEIIRIKEQFLKTKILSEDLLLDAIQLQFHLNDDSRSLIKSVIDGGTKHVDSSIIYDVVLSVNRNSLKQVNHGNEFDVLAIEAMKNSPYMTSIEKWLNWQNIYESKIGSVNKFVNEKSLKFDFYLIEIDRYHHIKVKKNYAIDDLVNVLEKFNAFETSQCIMSIIIATGHVNNAPLSLMCSHIENSFRILNEKKEVMNSDIDDDPILRFTLRCFVFIPFRVLSSIASKLFLSSLSMIYGSTNVSRLLLEQCKTYEEKRVLHALGVHLSDNLWITDMRECLNKDMSTVRSDFLTNEENKIKVHDVIDKKQDGENLVILKELSDIAKEENVTIKDNKEEKTTEKSSNGTETGIENESIVKEKEADNEEVEINPCFDLIECIRREQFGIGVVFDEEQQKLIEVHREREGRSLQRLSKELYSTDSHFALELIQNADDNHYDYASLHEGEQPTVAFILHADKIVVLNNEKGFMKEHIRALCDVGKSTKGIHRKGYIGQKGIGFKSVFRITDCPEIHSNGYHMKFDASKGPNGYILPTWIEQGQTYNVECEGLKLDAEYQWKTNIVLPLKKEMQISKLIVRFDEVHKSLLMFLNRLQRIIIANQVSGKMSILKKVKIDDNLIELHENEHSQIWFVVTKEISMKINDESKTTDISIAFPLGEQSIESQLLFAFLPLRSYGFKFIIQADFEIPSSREDIYKDSAWNQCILQNLPSLMVLAFTKFKEHNYFKGMNGILEFFKFMDIEEHVLDIFQPVAEQILTSLQAEECLPSMRSDLNVFNASSLMSENDEFYLTKPTSVIFSNKNLEEIISPFMLHKFLHLHYIHPLCQDNIQKSNLQSLGVKSISLDDLITLGVEYIKQTKQDDDYKWLAKWFTLIYDLMQEECDFSEQSLDKVRKCCIFPLSDNRLVSLEDTVVFLPVSYMEKNKDLQLIEKDLDILHRQLFDEMHEGKKQLIEFFKMLGMKSMQANDLIREHIIPLFSQNKWKDKEEKLLIACVRYLFTQYNDGDDIVSLETLKSYLVVKTNKGMKEINSNHIYIPKSYGNKIDLQNEFPSGKWTLISDVYIKGCSSKEKQGWFDFLKLLGLHDFITFRRVDRKFTFTQMLQSPWCEYSKSWPETMDGVYVIHDVICPEFDFILDNKNTEEIAHLAYLINTFWIELRKGWDINKVNVTDSDGKMLVDTVSSIYFKMVHSEWIPEHKGGETLYKPRQLFVQSKDIKSLFADHVPYVDLSMSDRDFLTLLQCQTDFSLNLFCEEFQKWIQQESFSSTYEHISNIYKYIFHLNNHDFNKFMATINPHPFIFLPVDKQDRRTCYRSGDDKKIKGKFYHVKQVCWSDPMNIFSQLSVQSAKRQVLDPFYKSFATQFQEILKVDIYPNGEEYVEVVNDIARNVTLPDKENCAQIFLILSILGETLVNVDEVSALDYPNLYHEQVHCYDNLTSSLNPDAINCTNSSLVQNRRILPCSNDTFTSVSNQPLLCFNKELARPFMQKNELEILFVEDVLELLRKSLKKQNRRYTDPPELRLLFVLAFFKACNLPALSNIYNEPELITQGSTPGCVRWEMTLHKFTPIIQRYIFSMKPNLYREMKDQISKDGKNFKDYLYNLKVSVANQIEVVHRLDDRPSATVKELRKSGIEYAESSAYFYVNRSHVDADIEDVLEELLTIFVSSDVNYKKNIRDFLADYDAYRNDKDKKDFLKRKNISLISDESEKWEFPEPFVEKPKKVIEEEVNEEKLPAKLDDDQLMRCWPLKRPDKIPDGKPVEPKPKLSDIWKPPEYKNEALDEHQSVRRQPRIHSQSTNGIANEQSTANRTNHQSMKKEENAKQSVSSEQKLPNDVSNYKKEDPSQNFSTVNNQATATTSTAGKKMKNRHSASTDNNTEPLHGDIKENQNSSLSGQTKAPNAPSGQTICDQTKNPINNHSREKTVDSNDTTSATSHITSSPKKQDDPSNRLFDATKIPTLSLETQYEDILLTNRPQLSSLFPSGTNISTTSTGFDNKLGEHIVFQHLQTFYKEEIEKNNIQIEWMNEKDETGEPFDIKVVHKDAVDYIEVKSTGHDEKKEFPISSQQIKFAFEKNDHFHLYRVSGLSSLDNVKVKRLVNLSLYLDNKAVRLFMVL